MFMFVFVRFASQKNKSSLFLSLQPAQILLIQNLKDPLDGHVSPCQRNLEKYTECQNVPLCDVTEGTLRQTALSLPLENTNNVSFRSQSVGGCKQKAKCATSWTSAEFFFSAVNESKLG